MKETTRKDWRGVDDVDRRGMRRGHADKEDLDELKKKSDVWVEEHFREELRHYPKDDEIGRSFDTGLRDKELAFAKEKKPLRPAGDELGSIYRKVKQSDKLRQEDADEYFQESLRSEQRMSPDEYQRRRRAHLKLPRFRNLSPDQVTKAKRIFASIDLDGSGSVAGEDMRKFLVAIGYKESDKAVKKLIEDADKGSKDSKVHLKEFVSLYHGMEL